MALLEVFLAVGCGDFLRNSLQCHLREIERVGTHVGDETHRALARDVHALVELLGDGHGAARRHIELARGLLLQGGSGERQRGRALLVRALDVRHGKGLVADVGDDAVHLLAGGRLDLFAVFSVIVRFKGPVRCFVGEVSVERPVFLRDKGGDLLLAVIDHAHGDGLHAAGGELRLHLSPEHRRQLEPDQPVEHAACLLRVNEIHVDVPRILHGVEYGGLGDFLKRDSPRVLLLQSERLVEVPRYGLPLSVGIGREPDCPRVGGELLQLRDQLALTRRNHIFGLEAVLYIHAKLIVVQIPDVPFARLDDIFFLSQIFLNLLRFRRRLDNYKIFRHIVIR